MGYLQPYEFMAYMHGLVVRRDYNPVYNIHPHVCFYVASLQVKQASL